MEDKIKVYATFDTQFQTWNVIQESNRDCLHYGTADSCDEWLLRNKETHIESHSYESEVI